MKNHDQERKKQKPVFRLQRKRKKNGYAPNKERSREKVAADRIFQTQEEMKLRYKIILLLLVCALSFFAGRLTTKTKETIKYVKGETIHERVEVPKYIYETIPSKPVFKVKTDTLYVNEKEVIVQTVDTQAIIRDYIAEREYRFNVFDNEYGKMDIDQTIQYNELRRFDYSFTPNQKVITQETKKIIVPFVSASYNTFNKIGIGGGIFYHNIGIEYQYMRDVKYGIDGHGVGIKVKF